MSSKTKVKKCLKLVFKKNNNTQKKTCFGTYEAIAD